jgi:hypothetical protein
LILTHTDNANRSCARARYVSVSRSSEGEPRSLTGGRASPRRSRHPQVRPDQRHRLPKLIVRVRFPVARSPVARSRSRIGSSDGLFILSGLALRVAGLRDARAIRFAPDAFSSRRAIMSRRRLRRRWPSGSAGLCRWPARPGARRAARNGGATRSAWLSAIRLGSMQPVRLVAHPAQYQQGDIVPGVLTSDQGLHDRDADALGRPRRHGLT